MRILGLIQARMGSKRLPGKVLAELDGRPLIFALLDRLRWSKRVDSFVVATTVLPEDDALVEVLRGKGFQVFRGHPIDVLDRFYKAASLLEANYIVRITADNPLTDPGLMDEAVMTALVKRADYVSFVNLPLGVYPEVVSFKALERAYKEAKAPYQREHVTPYINESPDKFNLIFLETDLGLGCDGLRLTVDYPEDLELMRIVFKEMMKKRGRWGIKEVLEFLRSNSGLLLLNRHLSQKSKFEVDEGWGRDG
ncbi:MAG: glycosyltransferase family protein [Synergistetes bacterium]|nr:MAG: Uncharacterized protein XD52_0370 [bacterium 42_11]MBC7331411.1 glycosyltransferase family protein [Synergistota bacterium]MDK2872110.1 spore coat polysaccharide biosynthesis protein SpsF [bacterium]